MYQDAFFVFAEPSLRGERVLLILLLLFELLVFVSEALLNIVHFVKGVHSFQLRGRIEAQITIAIQWESNVIIFFVFLSFVCWVFLFLVEQKGFQFLQS